MESHTEVQKYNRKNYKYIYSIAFANKLMLEGYVCRGTGINPKSGRIFYCFNYEEVQKHYENSSNE